MKPHPIAHALIRVAKSWYPGYRQAKQEHYITNIRVFDDQCVSIWFPAKSEGLGAGLFLQRPIVKMTPTILDKQSHYMAAMKI